MDGTKMKKITVLFYFLFIILGCTYSLNIIELSSNTYTSDRNIKLCYFDNYLMIGLGDIRKCIIKDDELINLTGDNDEYIKDKIDFHQYGLMIEDFFSSNFDTMYTIYFNDPNRIAKRNLLLCVETKIREGKIEHRIIDNNLFDKIKKDLVRFTFPHKVNLPNGYQIDFTYGNILSGYKTTFSIRNSQSILYDFKEKYPNINVEGMFSINNKGNRIVYKTVLDDTIYTKTFVIHELSIIYDAVCNDNNVRVRTEPNLDCETVTKLNKNDVVKIKDQTDNKFEIAGEKWYWYQVETASGKTGWVYGKYLDIEK